MVKYLASYMSKLNNPRGTYIVNIKNEIDKFKRKNPDIQKPVLIFDFIGTIPILFGHHLEVQCAGRQGECIRRAREIFQKFQSNGVDLVFFLDGPIKLMKNPEWCRRNNHDYERYKALFQNFKDGGSIKFRFQKYLKTYYENYLRVAKKFGRIIMSFENECDIDIAEYATRIRPLAVLGYDSDFLIMPGDWPIWLPDTLNMERFTVSSWCKGNLRKSLQLKQYQMPIFATLCGNDWINYNLVKHIYEDLIGDSKFLLLAELVREEFTTVKDIDLKITNLIYNNGKCELTCKEVLRLVKMSLDFYNYSTHKVTAIAPDWLRNHVFQTASLIVFILCKKQVLYIPQPYIDVSKKEVKPFSDLVLPLMRREMGILHNDNRENNIEHEICLKPSHEEQYAIFKYAPIYPNFDVPLLQDILETKIHDNAVPLEKKIEIFGWIVSPSRKKLKLNHISNLLNTLYIIPSVVLNYLIGERQITLDEADIVLLVIYETSKMDEEKAKHLNPPEKILERPFWISFTYTNIVRYFEEAMHFCGLSKFIPNAYFDGYIFHKMYQRFLSMEFERKQQLLENIAAYRLYVL